MTELTFEILLKAWDRVKLEKQAQLKRLVPGLSDASKIFIKRVAEDDSNLTISFQGLDVAVMDTQRDVPLLKNAILSWIRKFSSDAQIMRSDSPMLIIRISKDINLPQMGPAKVQAPVEMPAKYQKGVQDASRSLTNIIRKKPVG